MATIEGEFVELEDGSHTGVVPETHKDYRTWMYNRVEGEMLSKIVTGSEAEELFEDGWRMSPAEFTENEELKDVKEFIDLADDMAQVMNFLLNIDKCNDLMALSEFATNFFNMKVRKNATVASLRKAINKKAKKEGLYNDNSTGSN